MELTVVEAGEMILLGFGFYGDPFEMSAGWTEENEIGRLWKRLMSYLEKHRERVRHVKDHAVMYELHIYHEDTPRTGEFEVFVGLEVGQLEDVPLQMSVKILPAATYAVFTLRGEQITSDWPWLALSDWLPTAGYAADRTHHIQRYDERFRGLDDLEESVLEVYMPITSSEDAP
jgi:predicted transcriptional regulator YdeE